MLPVFFLCMENRDRRTMVCEVSILVLFSLTLTSGDDCVIGNEKSRSSALLFAHRCYLRDVPIKVPSPDNTIPDAILPSHIVVPRCSGNRGFVHQGQNRKIPNNKKEKY